MTDCEACGRPRTERYGIHTGTCRHCVHERDPLERLRRHYVVAASGCWEWTAYRNEHGYGEMGGADGKHKAHRLAYELLVGPIPEGLTLDHLCRNRGCVNPSHLEPVTRAENVLRGIGPTAKHARKTHCPQGHPYDAENTRVYRGRRHCRICMKAANRRTDERRRLARALLKESAA